jgi:type II secretory pathway pseudopilin PulG
MESPSELWWSLITIVGPIVLALVLLWAMLRNRAQRRGTHRTERATRDLYRKEEQARREGRDGVG